MSAGHTTLHHFLEAFLKQSIYIEAPISVRIYWQCKRAEAGDAVNRKRSRGPLNSAGFVIKILVDGMFNLLLACTDVSFHLKVVVQRKKKTSTSFI
jgi:hypothetical protein